MFKLTQSQATALEALRKWSLNETGGPPVFLLTGQAGTGKTSVIREFADWLRTSVTYPHYSNHGMQSPGGAVRTGDYKLLEYFENNTVQLFNLKHDIGEQTDLSNTEPEKVAVFRMPASSPWGNNI